MLSVPVGTVVPIAAGLAHQFVALGSMGLGWKIEFLWRNVGFYAVAGVPFFPLTWVIGGVLGWLGAFLRDAVRGGITVTWS